MKTLMIHEIFDMVKNEPNRINKIQILRTHNTPALREVLKFGLHPGYKMYTNIVPKYKADHAPEGLSFSSLFNEYKRLYIFLDPVLERIYTKGKTTKLPRKNQILIEMMESINPGESKILESMITCTFEKQTGISKTLVEEAFPGLLI
jgi:hypothetical protein